MINFFGMPYIDLRVSFNSFIPSRLEENIAIKLVDYYIKGKLDIESLITRHYQLEEINEGVDAIGRGEDGRGVIMFPD